MCPVACSDALRPMYVHRIKALRQMQTSADKTSPTQASTSQQSNNRDLELAAARAKQLAEDEKLALSLLAERLEQEQEQLRIQMENDAMIARQMSENDQASNMIVDSNAGNAGGRNTAVWPSRRDPRN